MRRVGQSVRERRTAAGLSQAALGAPYLTRAAVSRIELGVGGTSLKTLAYIARQLKCSLRDLIPPDA